MISEVGLSHDSLISVSYTHLDVYKRQPVDSAAVDSAAVSLSPDAGACVSFVPELPQAAREAAITTVNTSAKNFFIVTTSLLRVLKNKKRHELLTIHASLHDKIPSLSVTVFKRSVNFSITLIFGVSTILSLIHI